MVLIRSGAKIKFLKSVLPTFSTRKKIPFSANFANSIIEGCNMTNFVPNLTLPKLFRFFIKFEELVTLNFMGKEEMSD